MIMEQAKAIGLQNVKITDSFWSKKIELVRREMIPYQWNALNDRIPDAPPSYCIRNFKLAEKAIENRKQGKNVPVFPVDRLEYTPADSDPCSFFGWVFQDSDLYKWIEAVGYSLINTPDKDLEKTADQAIRLICTAQEEDGYLNTFYTINDPSKRFTDLKDKHELYCFGHLAEAAVSYYQATGKRKLLDASCRFADLIAKTFGEKGRLGYPGHEIAEMALVKLYRITGREKYLNTAIFFIRERGKKPYFFDLEAGKKSLYEQEHYHYHQAHKPCVKQEEAVGHAVRGVYLYSGMADISVETGDTALLEACKKIWNNIVNKKLYITGGIGATVDGEAFSFDYDLPNDLAYAETCAAVGLVFFARRMLEADPNAKYADVMERALYNGILSGMSEDGKSFFYVNPLEVFPKACALDSRKKHIKPVRQKWFGCACCPPNLARLINSIGEYCYTENETALFLNLYIGGRAEGKNCRLELHSDYLQSGRVDLNIQCKQAFWAALRIPEWSEHFRFSRTPDKIRNGYAYFYITEDTDISADFRLEIKMIKCSNLVRENIGKIAVVRGPVVYCLEEADNGKNLQLLRIDKKPCFQYDNNTITAMGYREEICESFYSQYDGNRETAVELTFIPYHQWANRGENEMSVYVRI